MTDLRNLDPTELAENLRCPRGATGKRVGDAMALFNAEASCFTIACLHLQPTDHVLEIGFGPGEGIAEAVRRTPEGFVAGIDHSPDMVRMATERNRRAVARDQAELVCGSADALPFEDASFDAVCAVNVLQIWHTPERELAECHRVLRSGGRLCLYVPDAEDWLPGVAETGIFVRRTAEQYLALLPHAAWTECRVQPFHADQERGMVLCAVRR